MDTVEVTSFSFHSVNKGWLAIRPPVGDTGARLPGRHRRARLGGGGVEVFKRDEMPVAGVVV